ncbi:hypothetical protein JCM19236_3290 [Vibrio sp. JCM 19236]|nr:hypothetical protein JCM19236_3290 [Vibrio sp. JCM 19236]
MLDVEVQHTIETMNSGEVVTTISKHYTSADGVLFGYEQSIDKQIGEDFTRLIEFAYDFNLDGVASFEGMSLDIGTKTETTEDFWRYVDESGAQDEGGVNGLDRTFDGGAALLSRTHPSDLNEIDMVQKLSVSIDASEGEITKVTDLVEYVVDGFVLADEQTYTPQWANQNTLVERNNIEVFYQDHQDWHADGT